MPFFPNSALCSKNYPRNINYMPAVIFFASLDFGKNCYSRTASYRMRLAYEPKYGAIRRIYFFPRPLTVFIGGCPRMPFFFVLAMRCAVPHAGRVPCFPNFSLCSKNYLGGTQACGISISTSMHGKFLCMPRF